MGFDENNYSQIPLVGKAASQQGATRLTSTPKLMIEANLNILDPIHKRGKVKRINSFTATQEQVETVKRQSKGGPVKSSDARCQTQPSTSTHENTGRPQVQCTTCGGTDHLRKDCHEDVFCKRCRTRSHTTEMCCVSNKTGMSNTICIYCGSTNHISTRCCNRPNDNQEEPRSTPRDLRECSSGKAYNRFMQQQVNCHQTRFDEAIFTNLQKLSSIPFRIYSRSGSECYINGTGQYTIQILGNNSRQPEEPTGGFPGADKSQQR